MVGGNDFEKIKGARRGKVDGGDGKARKVKRGGKRVIPHAGDEPALFEVPPISDDEPITMKDTKGLPLKVPIDIDIENSESKMSVENIKIKEPIKKGRGAEKMDSVDAMRDIEENKKARIDRIKVGKLNGKEREDPENLFFDIPKYRKESFSLIPTDDQANTLKVLRMANEDIRVEWIKWKKRISRTRKATIVYNNGNIHYDASEIRREELENKESETEKELDPEDVRDVIEDIEKQWKVIMGVHQDVNDEEDRILILRGTISDYGKKQLENILGASKKQAKKIVGAVIDKILAK